MAIQDLFFKRKKRERGEYPDVYQYEDIPHKLKVQIVHVWRENFIEDDKFYENEDDKLINACYGILCKELGVFKLNDSNHNINDSRIIEIYNFFLQESDHEIVLSVIELMHRALIA